MSRLAVVLLGLVFGAGAACSKTEHLCEDAWLTKDPVARETPQIADETLIAQIERGKSTKSDVERLFGEPVWVKTTGSEPPNGSEAPRVFERWTYRYYRDMPDGIGLRYYFYVCFDNEGVVLLASRGGPSKGRDGEHLVPHFTSSCASERPLRSLRRFGETGPATRNGHRFSTDGTISEIDCTTTYEVEHLERRRSENRAGNGQD